MKKLLILSFVLNVLMVFAQPNTEVYLFDITEKDGKIQFSNLRNISNNDGYDNQPSFYDDNTILFSSTRNGQTDIAKYDISTREINWISDTEGGSEYSPLRIPESNDISAVRLDSTGYQRLYRYDIITGKSNEILADKKVGYHVWQDDKTLITTVLVENGMDLMISDLNANKNSIVEKGVGRSLHKIPGTNRIAFLKFEDDPFTIKSLEPSTGKVEVLTSIMGGIRDICVLPDGSILAPEYDSIIKFNPKTDEKWQHIWQFENNQIGKISRMAVSPDGKKMALVSEKITAIPVQKQVEAFNAADLVAFTHCYSADVVVRNFPNDTLSVGNKALKLNYAQYFKNSPKTTVEVVKRIQIGGMVIDEELVHRSGKTHRQAAIYKVAHGKIASMTFVHENKIFSGVEAIIEKNLTAYRARDIDTFLSDYSENVQVYMFPNTLSYTGKEKMRAQYADFLKSAEGLTCEIKNRIVVGNIVIDEEYLTLNGNSHAAVAIYEVENDKIAKVTFIQ